MSYVEDMVKIGVLTPAFVDANYRLMTAYYSAIETTQVIGLGRFYLMRNQLDEIRQKASNELFDELNKD